MPLDYLSAFGFISAIQERWLVPMDLNLRTCFHRFLYIIVNRAEVFHRNIPSQIFNSDLSMEFHYSNQTRSERQMGADTNLEFEGVEYSDAYYAELGKQILLLTADDDEEVDDTAHYRSADTQRKQDSNSLAISFPATLQPGSYFNWWERQKTNSVPAWPENSWRSNGNGTGVFIPQIVNSRRYRRGRVNNVRRRSHKPVEYCNADS